MSEKHVWLVGGSIMAEPMAMEIDRRGYKLILTDGNENCHCRYQASHFEKLSVYDVQAHLDMAAKYDQVGQAEIAAVLTIGTDAGPTVSALSEHLGLSGVGRQVAENTKNKIEMRKVTELPHPYYFIYSYRENEGSDNQVINRLSSDNMPLVIKSPRQAGSRGLEIVYNKADMDAALNQRTEDALIEELLIGVDIIPEWRQKYGFDTSEAAFDFFVEGGQIICVNGALRMFWVDQLGIEAGHINPFYPNDEIVWLARVAARKLGVTWGPFKIDVKKDRRYGWCLLECATRLSGGFDHMVTAPLSTGRDATGIMLDVALGDGVDKEKLYVTSDGVACCFAPRYDPGEIGGWELWGAEEIAEQIFFMKHKGIDPLVQNQDRPVFIITKDINNDKALGDAMLAAEKIQPKYTDQEVS